ncbi:Gfo/Idh/MocA family oxidoreductase [Kribbella turkmenica]|uniref:Gfo/Idh/MocA family oxidoreductase n=1 Tax=Kribbella turkmenica TaxID=2530375 RepID=A0A4R4WZY1_9ACTN|nr:Gfo/Idh/MocA family oxidoreductase [Kribbella turkmenica]TDD23483.1 Gfo/Idh/MocA family oxidoreductase [Kribbella turkmenica]
MSATNVPAVALVGTAGFGRRHLEQLLAWHGHGLIRLAALVDLTFADEARQLVAASDVEPRWDHSLEAVLETEQVDVAVVATPPISHFALAETVLRSGSALYLEKPPVPLLQQLDALRAIDAGRRAEVGFQHARATIEALEPVLAEGAIGTVDRITAHGCLSRPDSYYTRSAWAGSWFADGRAVLDGVLFNPLAHVVHTALTLARLVDADWAPAYVEAELYAVHDITGDDTAALRVRSPGGPDVIAVGTTAADVVQEPAITVHGSRGQVTVRHRDAAGIVQIDGRRSGLAPRRAPAEPLLAAVKDLDGSPDPLIDLDAVRSFVAVANAAVELVGAPIRIPATHYQVHAGSDVVRRLAGSSGLVRRVIDTGILFAELGAGWARKAGSLDVRGYVGLSHPELADSSAPGRLVRPVDREAT